MNRYFRASISTGALLLLSACASPPAPVAPAVSFEQKLAWILQLEDQRILEVPEPPPPAIQVPARRGRTPPPPPPRPSLLRIVSDPDARVRRRAAIAVGRVGLKEGIPALTPLLADTDPEVRQAAAFALGTIADPSASTPLVALLADADPLVRGRAAEGLGLIAARHANEPPVLESLGKEAAGPIAKVAAEFARSAGVAAMLPDADAPSTPEAEAFRLALGALVRLRSYEGVASAALDKDGRPVSTWWPVAYALQRLNDPRAVPALRQLAQVPGKYTAAFAVRGLGASKDPKAADVLLPLLDAAKVPREVVVSAIRAAGALGVVAGAARLAAIASDPAFEPNLRLEAVGALGALKAREELAVVQDLLIDDWPAMRAAALRAAAAIDQESFVLVLSGLEPDRYWAVRAALADVLATLPADLATDRVRAMLKDEDKRVVPAVLRALVRLRAPDAGRILLDHLGEADFVIRETAARLLGQVKPPEGIAALREAYKTGQPDSAYSARAAALEGLAEYGGPDALEGVRAGLADKDWAVRVRTLDLLAKLEPGVDHRLEIRPAPAAAVAYDDPQLIAPTYSPHVFIETAKGTIEFELAVLDAPQTARNFMALVRKGFFNGLQVHRVVPNFVVQDGDARGDGEGGPGYTIRDELNDRPYRRGTVGMALSWRDTGGSQFFITHSPQPHLDGLYTAFGRVVNGMDVVDRIQHGDLIARVRVWDGTGWQQ